LYLVNDTVVLQRQALRLVINPDDAIPAPARPATPAPIANSGPRRLSAARVGPSPVPGFHHPATQRTAPTHVGEVRREMLAASCLSPEDARLIVARRAAEAIEGGSLARLSPMRRRGLERLATKLGLRAFDTSLVIAIAQDAARSGERVDAPGVRGRLGLVGAARDPAPSIASPTTWCVLVAALLAAALVAALGNWIVAG
jgi:hypothetical protein